MIIDRAGSRAGRALRAGAALLLALSAGVGCDRDELPEGFSRKPVPVAEVPEGVMGAARKELPGVQFDEAWKNLDRDGKAHSFEIRGRTANGKIREARVGLDGKILETE